VNSGAVSPLVVTVLRTAITLGCRFAERRTRRCRNL
jgi:hypothetical protein